MMHLHVMHNCHMCNNNRDVYNMFTCRLMAPTSYHQLSYLVTTAMARSFESTCYLLQVYYDELELCNPLGSRRKKHKIGK